MNSKYLIRRNFSYNLFKIFPAVKIKSSNFTDNILKANSHISAFPIQSIAIQNKTKILLKSQFRNFSNKTENQKNEELIKFFEEQKINILTLVNSIKSHYKNLNDLKSALNLRKDSPLENTGDQIFQYSCHPECLTINRVESRERLEKGELTFFITESRNKLKIDLKSKIKAREEVNESCKIQIMGPAGVGKTYGLAEFTVIERIINLDPQNKFIIYHHFNEKTNDYCALYIRNEIFCAIYPLIEKELNLFIDSGFSMFVEKDSLLYFILKTFSMEEITIVEVLENIIRKLKHDFPEKQILIVFDQINEIDKYPKKKSDPGRRYISDKIFDKVVLITEKIKLNLILCASNNNEFNRSRRFSSNSAYTTINHDLNLRESEVQKYLNQLEFRDKLTEKEFIDIIKFTQNVPLFLNKLKQIINNDKDNKHNRKSNTVVIKEMNKEIAKFILEKARAFYNNYYASFTEEEKKNFKEILFYLNRRDKLFNFDNIKDILDYQLIEPIYPENYKALKGTQPNKCEDTRTNDFRENEIKKEFYDYIEEKIYPNKNSNYNSLQAGSGKMVAVVSRYPSILNNYKRIFDENKESLILSGNMDLEIRDFINDYNINKKNQIIPRHTSLNPFRSKGLMFEDIMTLYFKLNQDESQIEYPADLKFLKKWKMHKYLDALDIDLHLVQQNIEYLKSINGPEDFFSQYPPDWIDLVKSYIDGLFFTNLTRSHQAIDGGFIFYEEQSDSDNRISNIESERFLSEEQAKDNVIYNSLTTYDITTNNDKLDNENVAMKISEYCEKLKEIAMKMKQRAFRCPQVRLERHLFIILENEDVYDYRIPFPKEDMKKARELDNRIRTYATKEFQDIFKIYVARFIEKDIQEIPNQYTIQLIPYEN